ncbi:MULTISPECIES: hypothetical protein [Capnocytophaga]|uniref:hypothetical protein n=1 Tax=Capnocytophaga TaxID=1016 RepID=UPI000BB19FA2|nr:MULTISPECIES: hypothetical protein [Capnocytophaga]ATA72752.1 hypothetical protein CGC49_05260 [Capnocytophaga sp. H4358]
MKQIVLKISIILFSVLLIACKNQSAKSKDTLSASEEQKVSLPELKAGEENVFENNLFRLVDGGTVETSDGIYNTLKVQPKNSGIATFEIEGTVLTFEGVVGSTLLVSEGTGTVGLLTLFDLTSGKEILQIENFTSDELSVENDNAFYYYAYDQDLPTVAWSEAKKVWEPVNKVPKTLLESQELKDVAENNENLFEGMPMMAKQKIRVDIQQKKIIPLNEYKWLYIE